MKQSLLGRKQIHCIQSEDEKWLSFKFFVFKGILLSCNFVFNITMWQLISTEIHYPQLDSLGYPSTHLIRRAFVDQVESL